MPPGAGLRNATKIKHFAHCVRAASHPTSFGIGWVSPVVETDETLEARGLCPLAPFVTQALRLARIVDALRQTQDHQLIAARVNRPPRHRQLTAPEAEVGD